MFWIGVLNGAGDVVDRNGVRRLFHRRHPASQLDRANSPDTP